MLITISSHNAKTSTKKTCDKLTMGDFLFFELAVMVFSLPTWIDEVELEIVVAVVAVVVGGEMSIANWGVEVRLGQPSPPKPSLG